jgi:hypothetical protein
MIVTHGMSASGAYRSYYSARERCLNPNHVSWSPEEALTRPLMRKSTHASPIAG